MTDNSKSLQQIENQDWTYPDDKSHLANECKRLWKVPLCELNTENLRLLIGQKVSLKYLVPLVLDILEKDPIAEGNLFKGDLLNSVINLPEDFWLKNTTLNDRVVEIKTDLETIHQTISTELLPILKKFDF